MLRKSYRLMQKTKTLIDQTRQDVEALYSRHFDRPLPPGFSCCPPELWRGNAQRGAEMASFIFGLRPEKLAHLMSPAAFDQLAPDFHSFSWLLDLAADGTAEARRAGVMALEAWLTHNINPTVLSWNTDLIATRLMRWAGGYGFILPLLDPRLNERLIASFGQQGRILRQRLHGIADPIAGLRAATGLISAGIALNHDPNWIESGLNALDRHVHTLILPDGGIATRRPDDLVIVLSGLLDARRMLSAAALPVPVFLAHAIDRAIPALRFFRLGDGGLATTQGGSIGDLSTLDALTHHAGASGGLPLSLPFSGYERLSAGNTALVIDTGQTGPHAGALSFEMSVGNARLIVNCGSHAHDPMWRDLLAATAAHSTLTIDNQDNRAAGQDTSAPTIGRAQDAAGTLLYASHEGYMTRNGFVHQRRLYLTHDGLDLRGEDVLTTAIPPLMPLPATLRFHLHPQTTALMDDDGAVVLHLPTQPSWTFRAQGAAIQLEDSVYLGATGLPQKTQQIVLTTNLQRAAHTIRWGLSAKSQP